ncbi:MAG: methyltransferase domain-containing protein [Betaproteobacteria bacterium]
MSAAIHRLADRVSARNRARKHAFFLETMKPTPAELIVDIGANATEYSAADNYLEKHYAHPEKITVVSLDDVTQLRARYPKITFIQGDGTRLPFEDRQFSIAYSNAVIEHVGAYQAQLQFLREMMRVSRRGFMTTPNRHFPVETHTRVPLLHLLLPKPWFDAFLRRTGRGWAAGDYMRLLTKADLKRLLHDAGITRYRITHHRLLGLTLTYTVTWER